MCDCDFIQNPVSEFLRKSNFQQSVLFFFYSKTKIPRYILDIFTKYLYYVFYLRYNFQNIFNIFKLLIGITNFKFV